MSEKIYACEVGPDAPRVAVEKAWFKAHCQTFDNLSSGAAAQCDAYATASARVAHPAAPSKVKTKLKIIGYTAIGVGLLVACAVAGGGPCGFAGGE